MKRKGFIVLLTGITLFVLFLAIAVFSFKAYEGSTSLDKELNQVIVLKDPSTIAKLSANEKTKEFFMNLSSNTKAERTSSPQGGAWITNEHGVMLLKVYFVTVLNGEKINVFMYQDSKSKLSYKLFPKWMIASLETTGESFAGE